MESFEITEDDLRKEAKAMGLGGKRRRGVSNKEYATFGVFGDDDNFESKRPSKKGPVRFVSGPKTMDIDEEYSESNCSNNESEHGDDENPDKPTVKPDAEFGKWQQHTTGFGAKMLEKMGWKSGQGLGKGKEGIVKPVEVKVRPKGMGLAFGDFEEQTESAKQQQKLNAEEMLEQQRESRLIDKQMRWKFGHKVSREALDTVESEKELQKSKVLPELRFNVRMIVNQAHSQLRNQQQSLKLLQKQMRDVDLQVAETKASVLEEPKRIQKLRDLRELLLKLRSIQIGDTVPEEMKQIRQLFWNEFEENQLERALCFILASKTQDMYQNWDPLSQPQLGVTFFKNWREFLSERAQENLFKLVWLPKVHQVIKNEWLVSKPEPLIYFVETWRPVVTETLMTELVIEQILIPHIREAIESWNPDKNSRLHTWIFPWLPVLGDGELQRLLTPCQDKLSIQLKSWNPRDKKARELLKPWEKVLNRRDFLAILQTRILPKLKEFLRKEFQIDPRNQVLEPLELVFEWLDIIPVDLLMEILEVPLFHQWLHILFRWLQAPEKGPEFYAQVSQWYSEWKNWLPDSIKNHPVTKSKFTVALNMMNYCMDNEGDVDGFASDLYASPEPPSDVKSSSNLSLDRINISFKEVVEHFAAKHGLLFLPSTKPLSNGKQCYEFGNVRVYLEDDLVHAEIPRGSFRFLPVSLNSLLEMQQQQQPK